MKRRTAFDYNNCNIEIAFDEGAIDSNCEVESGLQGSVTGALNVLSGEIRLA